MFSKNETIFFDRRQIHSDFSAVFFLRLANLPISTTRRADVSDEAFVNVLVYTVLCIAFVDAPGGGYLRYGYFVVMVDEC